MQAISLVDILTRANHYLDITDYKAANILFSLIQEHFPEQPDCLHGMGVLALKTGYFEPASILIKRALKALSALSNEKELASTKAMFLAHLGRAAQFQHDFAFATICLQQSLSLEKNALVQSWLEEVENQVNDTLQQINNYIHEKSMFPVKGTNKTANHLKHLLAKKKQKNVKKPPNLDITSVTDEQLAQQIQAWIGQGSPENARNAEIACQELLKRYPDFSDGLHWMGIACHYQKRSEEALEWLKRAISVAPKHPYYHNTLGVVLRKIGSADECVNSFKNALRFKPDYAEAGMNLGNILRDENEIDEAIGWYLWAQQLKDNYYESWNNLGILYKNKKEYEKARESFYKALELNPNYPNPYLNIAVIHEEKKERLQAVENYRKTLTLNPRMYEIWLSLIHNQMYQCDWEGLENGIKTVRDLVNQDYQGELLPFNFMALPGTTGEEQRHCAEIFVRNRYMNFIRQSEEMNFTFKPLRKEKLRVGFVSADFYEHAVAISLVQTVELLSSSSQFELYAYVHGKNDNGPTRHRLIRTFKQFIEIEHLNHKETAQKIYEDQIDILVDLTGYTASGRAEIMALRPAPIQVNYLGYPGTMAAPFIDYIIGDNIITPVEHQHLYTEKLALLPHCYFPNDRTRQITGDVTRDSEGLPTDKIVFCSFNQPYKINPTLWDTWCAILNAVPHSVLWLHAFEMPARENLKKEATQRGIDPERILFATVKPKLSDHFGRIRLADIALDTVPYNGHTTTSDALWSGVPVITQLGESFTGRVAASMLTAAGLPELIAQSQEEYIRIAVSLATDTEKLKSTRAKIIAQRETCYLYDSQRLAKNLGRLFSAMYENWLAGNEPRIIQLEDHDA